MCPRNGLSFFPYGSTSLGRCPPHNYLSVAFLGLVSLGQGAPNMILVFLSLRSPPQRKSTRELSHETAHENAHKNYAKMPTKASTKAACPCVEWSIHSTRRLPRECSWEIVSAGLSTVLMKVCTKILCWGALGVVFAHLPWGQEVRVLLSCTTCLNRLNLTKSDQID